MYTLFVSCTRYLEHILKGELESIGASEIKQTVAGCHASADLATAYRICMWSRTASRVLLKLHEFEFENEEDLYRGAGALAWEEHFSLSSSFAVDANVSRSRIKNANYAALKIKDAIVDTFRKTHGRRPNVNAETPGIRFHLHTDKLKAVLYLDLSGESLHRRGYRLKGTQAPLRETSAAGMLLMAGWPAIAAQGGALVDPMCGSGTIPIEAALIAGKIAPGVFRSRFGFEYWKGHDGELWQGVREEAERGREQGLKSLPPLFASDKNEQAVSAASENIRRAGLSDKILVREKSFEEFLPTELPEKGGLIAVNPPYGVRLENRGAVDILYSKLGKWMKEKYAGYEAAVLAPDKAAAKQIGLRAGKINTLYNGNLKILLVRISLDPDNTYVPPDQKKAPDELASLNEDDTSGINMLVNRIMKNKRMLKKYLKKSNISCYRIYDADIPQYAAAIDIYEERYAVVQEYAPPSEIEKEKSEARLKDLISAVPLCFDIEESKIFLKQRRRQKGLEQYSQLSAEKEFYIVHEGGLKFFVNFTDYLDTGLFLDHRITRGIIREIIKEKTTDSKFLNLFAYTCTASVYAAEGGAVKTVSVDTSNTYLEWGKKNFKLNRLLSDSHLFVHREVFHFLQSDFEKYDLIFIDPPTFSNRKSDQNIFDVQRDHLALITLAAEHLHKDGRIVFSNNYRRFKLDQGLYELFDIEDISGDTIPQDFSRNRKIHYTWILKKSFT